MIAEIINSMKRLEKQGIEKNNALMILLIQELKEFNNKR